MIEIKDRRNGDINKLGGVIRYTFLSDEFDGKVALTTEVGYVIYLNRNEVEMANICFEQADDGRSIVIESKCFGCVRGKNKPIKIT